MSEVVRIPSGGLACSRQAHFARGIRAEEGQGEAAQEGEVACGIAQADGDRIVAHPFGGHEDHLGPPYFDIWQGMFGRPSPQLPRFLGRQIDAERTDPGHVRNLHAVRSQDHHVAGAGDTSGKSTAAIAAPISIGRQLMTSTRSYRRRRKRVCAPKMR